jgi:hypothetical protein
MLRDVASRISGKGKPLPEKTTIGGGPNGDSIALKEIAAKMAGMSPNDAAALSGIAQRLTACNPKKSKKPCGESGADDGSEGEDAKALKDVAVKLMKLSENPSESPKKSSKNDLWQQVKALETGFNDAAGTGTALKEDGDEDDAADKKPGTGASGASGESGAAEKKTPLEQRLLALEKQLGSSTSGSSSGSGSGSGSGSSDGDEETTDEDPKDSKKGSGKGSGAASSGGSGATSGSGSSGSGSSASSGSSSGSGSGSGSSADSGGLWKRPKVVKRGAISNGVDIPAGKGDGVSKYKKPCPKPKEPKEDCA